MQDKQKIEQSFQVIRESASGVLGFFNNSSGVLRAATTIETAYNKLSSDNKNLDASHKDLKLNHKNTQARNEILQRKNNVLWGFTLLILLIALFAILKPEKFSEVVSRLIFALAELFTGGKTEAVCKEFGKTMGTVCNSFATPKMP